MKFKTLKDLEKQLYENCCADAIEIIKQEAIKWVNKKIITEDTWIEFFNITEEDLK